MKEGKLLTMDDENLRPPDCQIAHGIYEHSISTEMSAGSNGLAYRLDRPSRRWH